MQKITPFLWFNGQAEEAAKFYASVFRNSKVKSVNPTVFTLEEQEFFAFDGGPMFQFSPAISLFVDCATQSEVDELWARLSEGGEKQQCGWLKDKFGISWQIIPRILMKLMRDKDPKKSAAVVKAMLQMTKIDIKELKKAHASA